MAMVGSGGLLVYRETSPNKSLLDQVTGCIVGEPPGFTITIFFEQYIKVTLNSDYDISKPLNSYASGVTAVAVDENGLLNSAHDTAGLQPLPKGAMPVYQTNTHSPPTTPSQPLLEPDNSHVQFATYPAEKIESHSLDLKVWFWLPLVVILAGGAIALEVALHFSKKNQGWASSGDVNDEAGILHYVYTLPPVATAAILVAMWTWTDIEIKKMQPYVDLVHGDSPPHRSLLLDYTRSNNFVVWTRAASNKHYLVALASLMVVLSLSFQPLAAALLAVRDTYIQEPDVTLNSLKAISLNPNVQVTDLTAFLTAAGYASASVLYHFPDPSFINGPYSVAPFQLPINLASNGTVFATQPLSKAIQAVDHSLWTGWNNSASFDGCSIQWSVDKNATTLFGTTIPFCSTNPPPQFSPVVFWFFTYKPTALSSATICFPSFTLWDVNVNVDLASGNLTKVTELQPFSQSSNFSSFSANVTGPPLNGQAYNGIQFNLTNPDRFVLARQDAVQLQLPAAVYQSALNGDIVGAFNSDLFVQLANSVYRIYLNLVAKEVYFVDAPAPLTMQVKTIRKRVWLSDTAVHLLSVAMLLLASFATIIHLFHRADRRNLHLRHEPGTIASAVSIGAQTGMGDLLAGRQRSRDISEALQDKRFRIDPETMKIVMAGEPGYEFASSPMDRRRSVFAALQGNRSSRRFSKPPRTPTTPQSGLAQ
ncbi:hypothetical protein BD779DRAFT_1550009 [Infundibulicybe gibba]|nr:hypothetical protein BD779DRAFT_1550009 [Infundibulicybe gibba]